MFPIFHAMLAAILGNAKLRNQALDLFLAGGVRVRLREGGRSEQNNANGTPSSSLAKGLAMTTSPVTP